MDNTAHLAQRPRHKLNSDTHVFYTTHESGVCNDNCTRLHVSPHIFTLGFSNPGSSLARDEKRNMFMFGGHSHLGKMRCGRPFTTFDSTEDRYPCRGGGRRGGRPIANGNTRKRGEGDQIRPFFYLTCLPAQRGTLGPPNLTEPLEH